MTQARKPVSIFPDYPRPQPAVDKKGNFTPLLDLAFSFLFQTLQKYFTNEGILLPPLTAFDISNIQAIYTPFIGFPLPKFLPDISGQTIFDSRLSFRLFHHFQNFFLRFLAGFAEFRNFLQAVPVDSVDH